MEKKKNMIKVKLITLCDYASVSKEGKLNINGIFDEFRTTKLPGVLGRAFLVAILESNPNTDYRLKVKLIHNESGDSETVGEFNVFSGSNGKHNLVVEIVGARFIKEGEYLFKVYHDDDELSSVSLNVIHLKQAQENIKVAN